MLGVPWVPNCFFFIDIFVLRCNKPASQIVLSRVRLLYNLNASCLELSYCWVFTASLKI